MKMLYGAGLGISPLFFAYFCDDVPDDGRMAETCRT